MSWLRAACVCVLTSSACDERSCRAFVDVNVATADGAPISGATVTLDDACCRGLYFGASERTECHFTTDSRGNAARIRVGGGVEKEEATCTLTVEATGFRSARENFEISCFDEKQTQVVLQSE